MKRIRLRSQLFFLQLELCFYDGLSVIFSTPQANLPIALFFIVPTSESRLIKTEYPPLHCVIWLLSLSCTLRSKTIPVQCHCSDIVFLFLPEVFFGMLV